MQASTITRRPWGVALLGVALASFCALVPWLHYGIASGHDFEFHMNSWIEVLNHWKHGVINPHWAAWAHYGYGDSRFVFYPPLSWTLGGILGAVLPWHLVPAAYAWLALTLAGLAMFSLARHYLSPGAALFAAVFYTINPYHLVIVYWRSAFAELLASALFPLLFVCLLRHYESKRVILYLSLLLAISWLINVPSAIMLHYLLACGAIYLSVSRRSLRPISFAAISVVAGFALAAIYLVPVVHQRAWINLGQVVSPGLRPQDNFLFSHTSDPDHDRFNRMVSIVALCEFALLALSVAIGRSKRSVQLWWPLLAWSSLCLVWMFPVSSILWSYLPQLRYIQFPWRWLLTANVGIAFIVAAIPKRWVRVFALVLSITPLVLCAEKILAPWWDKSADVKELVDNQEDQVGYEDVDEYAPAGADPYDVDQNAPLAKYSGVGAAKVIIDRWNSEDRVVKLHANTAGVLILKSFNYPDWQITVDGKKELAGSTKQYAMTVPVKAGDTTVELQFKAGWDRHFGAMVSFASFVVLLAYYKRLRPPSVVLLKADG